MDRTQKGRPRAALFHDENGSLVRLFRKRWRHGRRGRPSAGSRRTARGRSRIRCRQVGIAGTCAPRSSVRRHQHFQRAGIGVEPDDVAVADLADRRRPPAPPASHGSPPAPCRDAPDMRPSVTSATLWPRSCSTPSTVVSLCSSGMPLAFGPWKRTTAMKSRSSSPALKASFSACWLSNTMRRRLDRRGAPASRPRS